MVYLTIDYPRQATAVPINVEFTLHRLNEFMMLMLGETILSITISPFPFATSADPFDSSNWKLTGAPPVHATHVARPLCMRHTSPASCACDTRLPYLPPRSQGLPRLRGWVRRVPEHGLLVQCARAARPLTARPLPLLHRWPRLAAVLRPQGSRGPAGVDAARPTRPARATRPTRPARATRPTCATCATPALGLRHTCSVHPRAPLASAKCTAPPTCPF